MAGSLKCQPGCGCRKHDSSTWTSDQRETQRRYRDKHRDKIRQRQPAHRLWYVYRLTPERWSELHASQDGCCYLCGVPLAASAIHVDHDRSCCSGERSCGTCVRGLACAVCNRGIGHFGDDPTRMRRVADNLEMANAAVRQRLKSAVPAQATLRVE